MTEQGPKSLAADPGLMAIELLYKQMMIDEEWSVRSNRGFTWWAYRLAQHVEASVPYKGPDGAPVCDIRTWTDVAIDIPAHDDPAAPALMTVVNAQETMSALVWNDIDQTISERCTSTVYADTVESWMQVLSTAAVLQNCAAHSRAHAIAEALGGRVAASNHPTSGERPEMDDVLNVPPQAIAPAGVGPSKFAGPLMERLAAPDSPLSTLSVLTNWDSNGLTAEFPFSGNRSTVELAATKQDVPTETALLQVMTDQPHPQLGSGALITLKLPAKLPKVDAAPTANVLNFLEATTDARTTLLGAWCVDPQQAEHVAFVSFIPSVLARGGILENLCIYNAVRTKWAFGVMND